MVEIFIENIIASATISSELDLDTIMKTLKDCEYNPDQFSGVIYRPNKPKVVVLLFNDGKVMVTAAKSVQDVESAINSIEKQLKDAGLLKPVKEKPKPEEKTEKEAKEEEAKEEEAKEETKEEETKKGPKEEAKEEAKEETKEETKEEKKDEKKDKGKGK